MLRIGLSTIEEGVHFSAVQIQKHADIFTIFGYPLFGVPYLWKNISVGEVPLTVHIEPRQVGTVVTDSYTIDIHHGNDFEDEVLSDLLSLRSVAEKHPQKPFHDER